MLALVALLSAAPPPDPAPSWPPSAGPAPVSSPVVYGDPQPHYFDPPPGRYLHPDGAIRDADPPPGFYDLPPGHYPRDPERAAATRSLLGPLPTAEAAVPAWLDKRRRLRIGLGVSGGILGASLLALPIGSAIYNATRSDDFVCVDCYPPGIFITLVLAPPAFIATVVYAIRLGVHAKRRPRTLLAVGPDGLRLRF